MFFLTVGWKVRFFLSTKKNVNNVNNWNENYICKNTIGDETYIQYTIYPNTNFFKENSVLKYEDENYTIINKKISDRNEYLTIKK